MNAIFEKSEVESLVRGVNPSDKIMLVGDEGIYLMSFGDKKGQSLRFVYALGCNPNKDEDYYENKVDIFGGDDGADEIGTAGELLKFLQGCKKHFVLKLSPTQIRLVNG